MKQKRHKIEKIMRILRDGELGKSLKEICMAHQISGQTYYRWKRKYAKIDISGAKHLKKLEEENRRLKRLLAEKELHIGVLAEVNSKNGKSVA